VQKKKYYLDQVEAAVITIAIVVIAVVVDRNLMTQYHLHRKIKINFL
jgi:hypothetical protein